MLVSDIPLRNWRPREGYWVLIMYLGASSGSIARRTATSDATIAWRALLASTKPADISQGKVKEAADLARCKSEVAAEIQRCARAPPRFSKDGRVALIRIDSPAQVHPVIASRWANSLKGKTLEIVMVANTSYLPNRVNFAMRIAKSGGGTIASTEPMDIIAFLRQAVTKVPGLADEVGADFARGHAQATGGSVALEVFDKVLLAVGFEEGGAPSKKKEEKTVNPKGTLEAFGFKKLATK
ncbi:hypothetical protein HK097_006397 [Rhizophlyctis rosea]|uniref:Uncharacterized protein n=1 Tax=Rhizophlyctis rosea TaxID=64517 RepID=A0AAD5SLS0_9FUNG|nr:hypothetical protein HK097_006397 [Rhizophlyctis rosea]